MPESPLQFAVQAASRVQGIVDKLCSPPNPAYHQFCNEIRTRLFEIVPKLQSLPDIQPSYQYATALLDELEKLCRVRVV